MRQVIIGGKVYKILTQQEKAEEQGVLPREIRRRLVKGLITKEQTVSIPGSTKLWYLPEGVTHEG